MSTVVLCQCFRTDQPADGMSKMIHLNNNSDYGGVMYTFSSIWWRDHVFSKVIHDDGALVSIYPMENDQCILTYTCSPIPKPAVYAHIYVYWEWQGDQFQLANLCVKVLILYASHQLHCVINSDHFRPFYHWSSDYPPIPTFFQLAYSFPDNY